MGNSSTGSVRYRRKILETGDLADHSLPMRKLSVEVVDTVVELLLCGWTPQDVVASWPGSTNCLHDTGTCPALGTVQRLAKEAGLSASRGGARENSGGARPGSGAPKGHRFYGGGRPNGKPGAKWSPHRDEVRRLRAEGHSLRVIAGMVGLRSATQVSNLLSDGEQRK